MVRKMKEDSLLAAIAAAPNLALAWRRVRGNVALARRARSCGVDEISVATFEQQWETHLAELSDALLDGSYQPLPPRRVEVPKPNGGKRVIAVLAVRDRVAQRATQQVLEPLFEPEFLECSYGFRPGRSVSDAVHQVLCYRQAGCEWVFDADIAACFDSLEHGLLLRFLGERVDDPTVVNLVQGWLESDLLAVDGAVYAGPPRWERWLDRLAAWVEPRPALPAGFMEEDEAAELAELAGWERQELWRRVRGDLALLGVAAVRPTVRRAGPWLRALARRRTTVLGAAGAAAAVGLAGLWWALRQSEPVGRGTLQGGALSPLLANIYLHHFDAPMTERGHRLVRYADDFVICCPTQREAEAAGMDAARLLADLRLRLNHEKTRLADFTRGFRFLGHQFHGARVTPALRPPQTPHAR